MLYISLEPDWRDSLGRMEDYVVHFVDGWTTTIWPRLGYGAVFQGFNRVEGNFPRFVMTGKKKKKKKSKIHEQRDMLFFFFFWGGGGGGGSHSARVSRIASSSENYSSS